MHNGENFSEADLKAAEEAIVYQFKDRELLKTSLTHKSWTNTFGGENNERLEFLGDAVLELIVTEQLYRTTRSDEGALTGIRQQYVSQAALEQACDRAGLMKFLRYSGGENNVAGKTASNLLEAVLGGIYLDGGMREARRFLKRFLKLSVTENYKSLLQEYVQEQAKMTPKYAIVEEEGGYQCIVKALGKEGRGAGNSKKAAEMEAAASLYKKLTKRKGN